MRLRRGMWEQVITEALEVDSEKNNSWFFQMHSRAAVPWAVSRLVETFAQTRRLS